MDKTDVLVFNLQEIKISSEAIVPACLTSPIKQLVHTLSEAVCWCSLSKLQESGKDHSKLASASVIYIGCPLSLPRQQLLHRNFQSSYGYECNDEIFCSNDETECSQIEEFAIKQVKRKHDADIIRKEEAKSKKSNCGFKVQNMIKDISDVAFSMKSDMYHIFKVKEASVDDVLKIPEALDIIKLAALDAQDKLIKEQIQDHEMKMQKVDRSIMQEKNRQKMRKKELKDNAMFRNKLEAELTKSKVTKYFKET